MQTMFTIYGRYLQGVAQLLAQVARRRYFWPLVVAVFLLYALLPLANENIAIDAAISSPALSTAIDSTRTTVKNAGAPESQERVFIHAVSPFAQVSIPYRVYWDTDQDPPIVKSQTGRPTVALRLDQITLFGSFIIMLALTLSTLYPKREPMKADIDADESLATSAESNASVPIPAADPSASRVRTLGARATLGELGTEPRSTARQVFAHEVKVAELRAEALFKRSTYLLTGGVLMAFIGVAVFYATLPDPLTQEAQSSYVIRAIRAGGMLIFLEAIAWFLLRQYRSLVEDFKSFHRIYMKRANYLAAITILDKGEVRGEDLILITALLGEDFSGRLRSGETTESLESMKNEGDNPVFGLMREAMIKAFAKSSKVDESMKSSGA